MKVLLTHSSSEMYGSDRMAAEAARALVGAGHQVFVALPSDGPLCQKMQDLGAVVHHVNVPVLRKSSLRPHGLRTLITELARTMPTMWKMVRDLEPDVVYVNTVTQPWWLLASWLLRVPSVTHVREAEPQLARVVAMGLMAPLLLSDLVICNSRSTQDEVHRAFPAGMGRVEVIYNGKDWTEYALDENEIARGPESQKPFVLLVVGRLSPRKGQDVVVRALGELRALGVDITVRLAGDVFPGYEWYEDELRELAHSLKVHDRVKFLGFVDDIGPELRRASAAVVPSRIEPFGTVAAESMAANVVTVVTEVQGLTEIVTDGETGITFPSEDASALARRCLWVLDNPAEASEIASAGRDSVRIRFTIDKYRTEIVAAIESVLDNSRRSSDV